MRSQFFVFSKAGCILPFLLITNLFFGWIFLKPYHWLLVGIILFGLFILQSKFYYNKFVNSYKVKREIIDIEAENLTERRKIK